MSSWTQIRSLILIDISFIKDKHLQSEMMDTITKTNRMTNEEIKSYFEKLIDCLPKISGSEGDAKVSVNPYDGPSMSFMVDGKFIDYNFGYSLTIVGNLRDREVSETKNEYKTFLKALKNLFSSPRFAVKTMTRITDM